MSFVSRKIAYLGCPYSDPDPKVRKFRERAVTQMAFDLHKQGILVYSPLTHNMPLDRLGILGDFQTWLDFDHNMLSRCNKLYVLKLAGWEHSKGLKAEIECATRLNIPIEDIEPSLVFLEKIAGVEEPLESLTTMSELLKQINILVDERDWSQFHSPKNLAMNLQVETAEVAEHFTWLTEEQSHHLTPKKKQEVMDELGDVFISLVQLSDKLGVDLFTAAREKIEKIKSKYPSDLVKGKAIKYTYYTTS